MRASFAEVGNHTGLPKDNAPPTSRCRVCVVCDASVPSPTKVQVSIGSHGSLPPLHPAQPIAAPNEIHNSDVHDAINSHYHQE